jgi:DNA-binding transcriptional MerR regulator
MYICICVFNKTRNLAHFYICIYDKTRFVFYSESNQQLREPGLDLECPPGCTLLSWEKTFTIQQVTTINQRRMLLTQHAQDVQQLIARLQSNLELIEKKIAYYEALDSDIQQQEEKTCNNELSENQV